jgi:CIC family chloride channel protein
MKSPGAFEGFANQLADLELHVVGRVLALSSLVGVVAGIGAIVFQMLCQATQHVFLTLLAGYVQAGPPGERAMFVETARVLRPGFLMLAPALGGLLTGAIVQRFAPEAAGHGTDEAVSAFHRRGGLIRGRVPIVKSIASAITLGSGGSGGREGPIAQIGAGFGSFLATRLRLPGNSRRVLLAAGVGAGVGSIFRAPLAGALFAAEVLYSDPEFEADVIIPAALSSIIAYCVFSLRFGFGSLFATPRFAFHSAMELLPYTALAIVVALASGAFVALFYGTHDLFQRMPIPAALRPALGGLATGALALAAFEVTRKIAILDVLSFGYGSIQQAIDGRLPALLLLGLATGKMLTTSLSIGSGGSGGVFGPSMVIGGALGGAVGIAAQRLLPHVVTQPGAYVVVGMAGFFAAAANTPISTLVMVSEMTGNYELLLPTLWVCALAYLLARRWTLYRSQVPSRLYSPAHWAALREWLLGSLRVRDVMRSTPVATVPESATIRDIARAMARSHHASLPVVDKSGQVTGIIAERSLRDFLDREGGRSPIIAHDLATTVPPLSPEDGLDVALSGLDRSDADELPVMDPNAGKAIVGVVSRRDVLQAYRRRLAADAMGAGGDAHGERQG